LTLLKTKSSQISFYHLQVGGLTIVNETHSYLDIVHKEGNKIHF